MERMEPGRPADDRGAFAPALYHHPQDAGAPRGTGHPPVQPGVVRIRARSRGLSVLEQRAGGGYAAAHGW